MIELIDNIETFNNKYFENANRKLDSLIKPIKSLGYLESIAAKLCAIEETLSPKVEKKIVVIMASDNGVCEEGVASGPQSVTASQTVNFLRGLTGVSVIARANNTDIKVIDIGILEDINYKGLEVRKINNGTKNIAREPAMTIKECLKAIEVGFNVVKDLKDKGYNLIGTGEMGIGNTTTSSSLLIALTNCTIEEAVDKGAGLTDSRFKHKKDVVERIINLHKEGFTNPYEALRRVGGFDIAGIVGLFLGAAYYKVPIVIDGFISAVSALCAYKINKNVVDYMFASHISSEKGYKIALKELKLKPMLNLNMRLGEGSGCPLAFNIMETAAKVICEMGTFEEGNIDITNYKGLWR